MLNVIATLVRNACSGVCGRFLLGQTAEQTFTLFSLDCCDKLLKWLRKCAQVFRRKSYTARRRRKFWLALTQFRKCLFCSLDQTDELHWVANFLTFLLLLLCYRRSESCHVYCRFGSSLQRNGLLLNLRHTLKSRTRVFAALNRPFDLSVLARL